MAMVIPAYCCKQSFINKEDLLFCNFIMIDGWMNVLTLSCGRGLFSNPCPKTEASAAQIEALPHRSPYFALEAQYPKPCHRPCYHGGQRVTMPHHGGTS
mmetsp:Transcript_7564/g.8726  ORF Transcript_7564/g.8726 Transcript_7564/m.8726 type:complete len:99 (+) Transcript_7564:481-777(+)